MKRKELILIIGSIVGTFIFLLIISPAVSHQFTAFRFSFKVVPGLGYTKFEFPPIGSLEAKTHLPSLNLLLNMYSINLDELQQLLDTYSKSMVLASWNSAKWHLLARLVLWTIFVAVLGGVWGSSWTSRRPKDLAKGALTGILVVLVLASIIVSSYDLQALANPTYKGAVAGVPWVMGLARNAWDSWSILGNTAKIFVRNLRQVMAQTNAQLSPGEIDHSFKILHVSDLHNNPQAMDFIQEICDNLVPDIIIDTGDLTDFGTPLEEPLYNRLSLLKTPYYLVLGNHDSPAVVEKVKEISGVTLLDGPIEVAGIQLVGSRDPASFFKSLSPASPQQIAAQVSQIQGWVQKTDEPPFILAVHDPRAAEPLAGEIPVILTGHTHANKLETKNGTIIINAGTTGGAGLRGLMTEKEVPLTAALLYVDIAGSWPTLNAVDMINLYPRENRFELVRTVIP